MKKRIERPALTAAFAAAETAAKVRSGESTASKQTMTTAIVLPIRTHELLRAVAYKRAANGKRISVSALIVDLVERHRVELEKEIR